MPEPFHSAHDAYLDHYRRTGEAKIIGIGREVEGRRKDGSTFPLELAVGEFSFSAPRDFTGIVCDVTQRKRAERQTYDMMMELKEGDRRKDEFLALLAHEWRGPLAPLCNGRELLQRADGNQGLLRQVRDSMEDVEALGLAKVAEYREQHSLVWLATLPALGTYLSD